MTAGCGLHRKRLRRTRGEQEAGHLVEVADPPTEPAAVAVALVPAEVPVPVVAVDPVDREVVYRKPSRC